MIDEVERRLTSESVTCERVVIQETCPDLHRDLFQSYRKSSIRFRLLFSS